LTVNKV